MYTRGEKEPTYIQIIKQNGAKGLSMHMGKGCT